MTIEEIKEALQDRNLRAVSDRTGITVVTLSNIRNGKVKNPSYETFKTLETYLSQLIK